MPVDVTEVGPVRCSGHQLPRLRHLTRLLRASALSLDHHVGTHCHGLRPVAAADGGRLFRRYHCQGPDSQHELQVLRGCLVRRHDEMLAGRLDHRCANGA